MMHLIKRGKSHPVYTVKYDLPKDVQSHFGKTAIWKSLGTANKAEALERAAPMVADIERQIALARKGNASAAVASRTTTASTAPIRLDPDETWAAIQRWKSATIQAAYVNGFNGELPRPDPGHNERFYALQQGRDVEGLSEAMAQALLVPVDHPALSVRQLRLWFKEAWYEAERHIEEFRRGNFASWDGEPQVAPGKPATAPPTSLRLNALLDRFLASQAPPETADIRLVWRRLVEFHGDIDAAAITPSMADEFAIAVRSFPLTKKPSVLGKPVREIITQHASGATLSPKSVWKWLGHVNRVFRWAVGIELVGKNPFQRVMPKKPGRNKRVKERRPYEPAEIAKLFSAPLFTGFHGKAGHGYRKQPGPFVVKDEKFWLPIFALWHGCRLEEIGAARVAELVDEDGVSFFNWTQRKLKTPESSRRLPIHPIMKELGWDEYVASRREAGDEYLFPNLPHTDDEGEAEGVGEDEDDDGVGPSTRHYSKWFGRWRKANGFSDLTLDFHSLRHTFKRQARHDRYGLHSEEISDLLTGHVGKGGIGRDYGKGTDLTVLDRGLAKLSYPTFPLDALKAAATANQQPEVQRSAG